MTWWEGFLQGVLATVTAGIILKVLWKCYRHIVSKQSNEAPAKDAVAATSNSISEDHDDNSISRD